MFKANTLFVVGAGASFEFGLPTGEGLKSKIIEALDIRFGHGTGLISGNGKNSAGVKHHRS